MRTDRLLTVGGVQGVSSCGKCVGGTGVCVSMCLDGVQGDVSRGCVQGVYTPPDPEVDRMTDRQV